jgi:hypothetical protein
MKLTLSATTIVALVTFVGTGIARADWLDDAWGEDSVRTNGNPAVSISGDAIYVVLPAATLHQAYEAGVRTEDALRIFLDRHGQHCSDLVDLNVPHPNLKVTLSLQGWISFEDIPERDEVLSTLENAYLRYHSDDSIPLLFTSSPVEFKFSIDYVPRRQVHCVAPKDDGPIS